MAEDRQAETEPRETPESRGRVQEVLLPRISAGLLLGCRTPPHSYPGTELSGPDMTFPPKNMECSQGRLNQPCFSRYSSSVRGKFIAAIVLGSV